MTEVMTAANTRWWREIRAGLEEPAVIQLHPKWRPLAWH